LDYSLKCNSRISGSVDIADMYGNQGIRFKVLPANWIATHVNSIMLMLLAGIKMAAIIGDNVPCTAKLSPIIL
jgi:hypothetical protein